MSTKPVTGLILTGGGARAAYQVGVLEAQRSVAERTFERTRRLFAQQAATSQQLDQAERDYRTLVAQIEAAQAQVRTASRDVSSNDARSAQIRDQIRKSRVSNPLGGTVLTTYAKAGEFVQIGQPLYKIANLDTVELRAYVTEPQLAQAKPLAHRPRFVVELVIRRATPEGQPSFESRSCRHVVGLRLGDEPVHPAPQLLGLGFRGGDAPGLEQGRAEIAHQRLSGVCVPVEVAATLQVPHRARA